MIANDGDGGNDDRDDQYDVDDDGAVDDDDDDHDADDVINSRKIRGFQEYFSEPPLPMHFSAN